MNLTNAKIRAFQATIFAWWKKNKRDLPWRHTHDPYYIVVSEIMLQQTQVHRALPKYHEFIKKFPTVDVLAKATPADVLRMWKGMGYNRRALYLHQLAKHVEIHGFPSTEQDLRLLPGIGPYTARAILVFAYKKNVAMVDTNIRHIITHFFFDDVPQKEALIYTIAEQLVPKGKSWEWHQALMDYGSLALVHKKNIRKQPPFKDSNRFYRGKIIDMLRLGSIEQKKLALLFSNKTSEEMNDIIKGLIKDKLVVKNREVISLPL